MLYISVADPGRFIPDPDQTILSSLTPDPDNPNIFSSRIQHEKWNANLLFSCHLCFQELIVKVIVKKIRDPEKNSSVILGKKAPDP
jgi:hypothetical protein